MNPQPRDELLVDEMTIALRDAQLEPSSWVYAWIADSDRSQVVYVGATGLPPTVRAWLHVNDDNPDIGRVRTQHPELLVGDVTVRSFRIHSGLDRQEVKVWVQKLLADPDSVPGGLAGEATAEQVCADRIVHALS